MKHITPTGFAQTGNPPPQLGSTEAVVRALPARSFLLIRDIVARAFSWEAVVAAGRDEDGIHLVHASSGPTALCEIPIGATVGVALDAFAGMRADMYEEMQAILAGPRFAKVIWA
jgi:hypothetical protein